ncbi:Gfo/Idh/MocA family protein [Halalkalibacter kiskunsagensis]|uniref:Gfo/Idh/MocA family protein n=1 Tax=Halalkalibacter kiskunsagensis TaxID=1548599 RepID=A0ABV6KFT0_9BACI
MEELKVIQVGTGGFGQSWLKVIMDYPQTKLVGIVDIMQENLDAAQQITDLAPTKLYQDPDLAFKEVDADLVLIVTPPKTHKNLAIKALQAGFHVLMEKPITHTLKEAQELIEVSKNIDKKIAVSQNYRWRAPILTAKKLLSEQVIGQVGYMEYEFRKAMKFGGWRDNYSEILLEDMSIHHFDIMRFLLGAEPLGVYAKSFRPKWSWFSGNPSATLSIDFENDIQVSYFGSWVSRGKETTWNGDIRIVGEKGAIEVLDDEVSVSLVNDNDEVTCESIKLVDVPFDDRTSSLDNMVQSIFTNTTPATSIEDNIKSFQLTCSTIESAQTGVSVKISEIKNQQ